MKYNDTSRRFANKISAHSAGVFKDLIKQVCDKYNISPIQADMLSQELSQVHGQHLSNCIYPFIQAMTHMGAVFHDSPSNEQIQELKEKSKFTENHDIISGDVNVEFNDSKDSDDSDESGPDTKPRWLN